MRLKEIGSRIWSRKALNYGRSDARADCNDEKRLAALQKIAALLTRGDWVDQAGRTSVLLLNRYSSNLLDPSSTCFARKPMVLERFSVYCTGKTL
jgi:hypothetical protein